MIIVKLRGGLGNQMFQYAFGKYLAYAHGQELKLDTSFLDNNNKDINNFVARGYDLDIFDTVFPIAARGDLTSVGVYYNNKMTYINKWAKKINTAINANVIIEKSFNYQPVTLGENTYLEGYWQSYKYFLPISAIIQDEFRIKEKYILPNLNNLLRQISGHTSVCLHVRRTDFLKKNSPHGFVGVDYYERAVNYLREKLGVFHVYIFSDDIDWCKQNLKINAPIFFVDNTYVGYKCAAYFFLMKSCTHFIIPNSTFSWWAAWLGDNPSKIVISPKKWFTDESIIIDDLTPESYVRL